MSDPKNILIIRLSAIGDVVFASPLIGALKRTYPNAKLSWLVEPAAAPLLKSHSDLDEVIIWPKVDWKALWKKRRFIQLWREFSSFKKFLKSKGYDLALDLQGLQKSALWAYLCGAPRRVGLGSKEGSHRLMTEVVVREGNDERISSEYLKMAQYLSLDCQDFQMDIALPEDEDDYALTMRQAYGEYIVICPFTTRPQKHWLDASWGELVEKLTEVFPQQRIVMLGGPLDHEASTNILKHAPGLVSMVGQCSLTQTAALIKHAKLLVGVDTGLTHMGIAFNRPTIALFGSTCPYSDTTHDNAVVLYHKQACSPCRRNPTCNGDFTCMKKIAVEEIMQTLSKVGL